MDSSVFFGVATVSYIVAMMLYIAFLVFRNQGLGLAATGVTVLGFVSQTLAFVLRWKEFLDLSQMGWLRAIPLTNLYESLVFFTWSLILIYLVVEYKYKTRTFGAFVTPLAGMALAFIEMAGMSKGIQPLVPALQSNWLLVHVFMSFISYATFALAFSTSLMYLMVTTEKKSEPAYIFWTVTGAVFSMVLFYMGLDFLKFRLGGAESGFQSDLFRATLRSGSKGVVFVSYAAFVAGVYVVWNFGVSLGRFLRDRGITGEMLDEITYKGIAVGFPVFTLGGLIFGAVWADQAWGTYWSWDPKETWSLITWFVYAFYLHARLMRGWKGHKIAVVSVLGFVAVIFTYLGVNLLLSGLHSYGGQ